MRVLFQKEGATRNPHAETYGNKHSAHLLRSDHKPHFRVR